MDLIRMPNVVKIQQLINETCTNQNPLRRHHSSNMDHGCPDDDDLKES